MKCEHLIIELWFYYLHPGLEKLGPDHHRHTAAQQEHGEAEDQVHRPDVFMVGGQQPAADAFGRAVVMFLAVGICNRTHENPRYRLLMWLVIVVIWR